ncbi:cytochrome P450 [Phascolomyces articulosus]|uniref:Cytochrome P450 n=1 Tax=Phascolomyces articulosus TaxID=60185 RepID=A0AAD5P9Y4_9FUNG|nr:cytochrome P450 [Phascolomyces articulosus]
MELNKYLSFLERNEVLQHIGHHPISSIAAAAATAITAVSLWKTAKKIWQKDISLNGYRQIPSPEGVLPYFGHLFQIDKDLPALKFEEWHNKYGPLIRVQMGIRPWIIIGNCLFAHEILMMQGSKTSNRPSFHPFLGYYSINQRGMTFTNPDLRWKRSRTVAQKIFATKSVAKLERMMQGEATRVVDLLLQDTATLGKINIAKYMQFCPLNVILQMCFGIHVTTVEDPLFQVMVDTVDTTVLWGSPKDDMTNFLPLFTKVFNMIMLRGINPSKKRYEDFIYQKRDPLFRQLIKEALESGDSNDCFVKELYKIKEANEFEEDDILVFLADLANAGTDPTAITLSWAFIILSHHIQKESIRYRPSNHFTLPHESTKDIVCQGYFIPKGSILLANTYSINMDPELYPDPENFIPDRYLSDPKPFSVSVNSKIDERDQFMFGWGRRLCPGVHFAEVLLFNYWVRIFATTIIEPPLDNQGNPIYPNLNARRDGGLVAPVETYLRFIKREDSLI